MKDYVNRIIKILDDASENESLDDYLIILQDTSEEVESRMNTMDDPAFYEKYYGV